MVEHQRVAAYRVVAEREYTPVAREVGDHVGVEEVVAEWPEHYRALNLMDRMEEVPTPEGRGGQAQERGEQAAGGSAPRLGRRHWLGRSQGQGQGDQGEQDEIQINQIEVEDKPGEGQQDAKGGRAQHDQKRRLPGQIRPRLDRPQDQPAHQGEDPRQRQKVGQAGRRQRAADSDTPPREEGGAEGEAGNVRPGQGGVRPEVAPAPDNPRLLESIHAPSSPFSPILPS